GRGRGGGRWVGMGGGGVRESRWGATGISPPGRGASCAPPATGSASRPASAKPAAARITSIITSPASRLRGLMAHRVRVLLHFLRGQVFLLPLPHLIEAGEAMDVAERMALEALVEVGLRDRPALFQLAREVIHRLDVRPQG